MEFITKEIETKLGLTPEQIEGIKPLYNDHIATIKGDWDKKANENAENILEGAVKRVQEKHGFTEARKAGEKYADYLDRVSDKKFEVTKSELETAKADLEKKTKEFKGDESLKSELIESQKKYDAALKKYADYDTIKEKADKYDPLTAQFSSMEQEVCFGNAKPVFPDTVNPYEADAKWNNVKSGILKDWDIKFKDGKGIAINKENPHKIEDLKKLIDQHEDIKGLLDVKKATGSGARQASKKTIEGVPFEVPAELDYTERVKLIREQCTKEGLDNTSPEWSRRFSELNALLTQKTAK